MLFECWLSYRQAYMYWVDQVLKIDSGCGLVFRFECAAFVTVTDHDFDLSLLPPPSASSAFSW